MPRRARLRLAEIPLHIVQRGNNHAACFDRERDRLVYLATMADAAAQFGCEVHAYVLMSNHVHLLLTSHSNDGVSLMMKYLGQRYSQYFNRAYGRSGTLWEGRFKSCLTDSETYVLRCYRYVELNPVRAGMVTHPKDYLWSSYHTNAEGVYSRLIRPHEQWLQLGATQPEREQAYKALCAEALDANVVDAIRKATGGNVALGNARFQIAMETALGRRASRGKAGRPPRFPDPAKTGELFGD